MDFKFYLFKKIYTCSNYKDFNLDIDCKRISFSLYPAKDKPSRRLILEDNLFDITMDYYEPDELSKYLESGPSTTLYQDSAYYKNVPYNVVEYLVGIYGGLKEEDINDEAEDIFRNVNVTSCEEYLTFLKICLSDNEEASNALNLLSKELGLNFDSL